MTDLLLDEVNSDLRRDRIFAFWGKWRKHIYYAAAALVVGTAASSIWDHHQETKAQTAMEQFTQARNVFGKGDYDTAGKLFGQLSTSTRGDLNDLVHLWQARTLAEQDKNDEAATVLAAIAAEPKGDDLIWRDLACLRLAGLDAAKLPAACADETPSPLKPQRYEFRAALLVEQGKVEEARALLKAVAADESASTTMRARAQTLAAALETRKAK